MDLHDLDVPVDAGTAIAVVAYRPNHSTHRRSVTACTDGVVAACGVPAIDVVHKTIAIVVHAVAVDLGIVRPVIANEVDVVVVGAPSL